MGLSLANTSWFLRAGAEPICEQRPEGRRVLADNFSLPTTQETTRRHPFLPGIQ